MSKQNYFTDTDMKAISDAIKDAETGISGEIVPVFIDECDNYTEAPLKAFAFGVLMALLALVVIDRLPIGIFLHQPFWFFIISLVSGMAFAAFTLWCKPVKRFFLSEQQMILRAQQKADTCFIAHRVYNTKQHTGIMIFIAFFERTVIIKPDFAIDEKVEQAEWDNITSLVVNAIRKKQTVKGMVDAINQCSALLKKKGFIAESNDNNELENKLHFGG